MMVNIVTRCRVKVLLWENYWFPSEEELSRMDACLHGRPEPGLIVEGHYLLSVRLLSALVSLSKH